MHQVENPGQSWNAVTVGAYSKDVNIDSEDFNEFFPVADVDELSPYSSTSRLWDAKWPIKPDVLFDGGNMAQNGIDYTDAEELSLLTTNNDFNKRPLTSINATSSATAQASWMAAKLYQSYPEIWPETVRALIIHSASWTEKMKKQFCIEDTKAKGRRNLLRTCGYGIPNLEKAIESKENSVNLVIEDTIQPYIAAGKGVKLNEMKFHKLPWTDDILRGLGAVDAKLKVTLSYFIEPGPGEVGWKDKYRYQSAGLKFDVINSNENETDFKKRINKAVRENNVDKGDSSARNWYLGKNNRDVGSIHSNYCITSAVDLCETNCIAVYPVSGWWKERKYLGKANSKLRYSLIVTIETPTTETDLYTPIINQIKISNKISIDTQTEDI